MKRMIFKNKRSYYSIPIFAAVCAATGGIHAARANSVDQIIKGGVDLSLDDPLNWSTGVIANSTNDILIAAPYPPAATNIAFSLGGASNASGTVNYGSINDTDPTGYYNYIEGSLLNTSSYTLNVGFGSNSIAPNSLDLIYTAANSDFDFLSSNKSYGALLVNFNQSGNLDSNGSIYSNSNVSGPASIVLNKTGTGLFTLAAANQGFKGVWNLSAGTMNITGGGGLGIVQTGVPELTFTGNSTLQFSTGANGVGSTRIIAVSSGVNATFDTNSYNVSVGGPVINATNGSSATLTKINGGILTLSGNFNFAGNVTTVSGGGLALGVNANLSSTALVLGAPAVGATYSLASGYNYNQSLISSVTLLGGNSNISAPAFNNSGLSVSLGTLSRTGIAATVDIVIPAIGTMTIKSANNTFAGGQSTIIGGFATVNNQSSWAVSGGNGTTPGLVSPLTTFDQTFNLAGADVDVVAGINQSPTVSSVNSIRFNDASNAYSITPSGPNGSLTIASGGILETANVASFNSFTGGTLTSGNGQDLIITQANATGFFLTIASAIVDAASGPIGLTTAGSSLGVILLENSNTFTGPTYVGPGKLELANQYALGNSTLMSGTVTFFQGIGNFTLGNIGTSGNIALQDNATPVSPINLTFGGNNQNTSFGGIFTGAGSVTKIGTGTTIFANANSTFTGGLTIMGGTIQFVSGAAFGLSNSSITNLVTIDNGAAIQYISTGLALFGSARGFILGGVATPSRSVPQPTPAQARW